MIVVPVKEGENNEKALKKFKRKFEKTGIVKELRSRQQFDKPSVTKRLKKERAVFSNFLLNFFSAFSMFSPSFTGTTIILLLLICYD